ncbi:hypothetical protein [Brevibacterium aurantiacum]|uniref:Uncharacterized protein n=1 Tax=Brevibacterium aurantiacum TaxID=273384 RepID=A0A2H1KSJ7_BREAU|nr:hypothetical protein [Brevibacterium aurantiacum]SMY02524.1 hypothetical protein BAUR920_03536 [Brevibacterium aurantiacum]
MNNTAFEDPAKTDLRAACEVAIDKAGYQIVSRRVKIPLPPGLSGNLRGDLQSLDGQDNRTFYFVRPSPGDILPKWLANYARASHDLRVGGMYVVVDSYSSSFKKSCAASGAGLLLLSDDNEFDMVLTWDEQDPSKVEAELARQLSELRRAMERKLKLQTEVIEHRHRNVTSLVSDMKSESANSYLKRIEVEYKNVEDWGLEISVKLDSVTNANAAKSIPEIENLIDCGPLLLDEE